MQCRAILIVLYCQLKSYKTISVVFGYVIVDIVVGCNHQRIGRELYYSLSIEKLHRYLCEDPISQV